jgi:signal peptidase I
MKIQVLDIVKRLVKWDKKLEVYTNGEDNAYPERVDRLINNSVTAKMSLEIMIQYLIGKGFGDADNFKVNDDQKLIDFATDVADDIAKNRGFFIHYDYNLNFDRINPKVLPFEKCRIGKKDSKEYNSKILFKNNWNDSKEKPIVFDVFNSNPDIVKSQIEKAGDISKYKGQVLYYNMDRNYYYPLSRIDAVMNDCDSESQASIYKNMILRKGFFGKQVIVTPPLIDNDLPEFIYNDLGVPVRNNEYHKRQSEADEIKETIESFIGAENAGGAMLIQLPDLQGSIDDIFKVITINSEVDDKMFEYTENSISKNILMAFNNLPISLVKSPDSAMFGNSGESLQEAKKMYWENTSKERNILETIINDVVQNLPNWNGSYAKIVSLFEVDMEANIGDVKRIEAQAQLKGSVGGVQALLQIQQAVSAQLTDLESAVVIIEEIYGISGDLARKMLGTPKLGIQNPPAV